MTELRTSNLNPNSGTYNNLYGDISNLPKTIKELYIGSNVGVYGDFLNLSSIEVLNISNTGISGSARFVPIRGTRYNISATKITGSIEEVIDATINAGYDRGSVVFSYGILGQLSFGGKITPETYGAAHRISWGYGDILYNQSIPLVHIDPGTPTKIWINNGTTSSSIKVKNFT